MSLKVSLTFHISYINFFVNNALISKALGKRWLKLNERKLGSYTDTLTEVVVI